MIVILMNILTSGVELLFHWFLPDFWLLQVPAYIREFLFTFYNLALRFRNMPFDTKNKKMKAMMDTIIIIRGTFYTIIIIIIIIINRRLK